MGVGGRDRIIKQLDQHGEVVAEGGGQTLGFFHLLEVEHIASVLVQEKVVLLAQKLNFDNFRTLVMTLDEYFDVH